MKKNYTLQTLLEEIKEDISPFKVGMIFETTKSIYPNADVSKDNKNIVLENKTFTKPLACDKKAKRVFLKDKSPIAYFFKEYTRGDFLKVVEVEGEKAKCINISLNEEIRNKFYKNEYIIIDINTIINGNVKHYRRKIDKFFEN